MTRPCRLPILAVLATLALAACDDRPPPRAETRQVLHERTVGGEGRRVMAEIWVDNWYALSVNGAPLVEDSVAFDTERSFNADRVTFAAALPATVAFEFRDFREDDTGLEYIGTRRQQVGDGGAIVQFTDTATGGVLGVSGASWKCLVVHHAPADLSCARESDPQVGTGPCAAEIAQAPDGWTDPGFDDGAWPAATEHAARDVGPKDGYDAIDWKPGATLIWSEDLKLDNTVLCRGTLGAG